MHGRCGAFDWAGTPLGPVETWPSALRCAVRLGLDMAEPVAIWAGADRRLIYNDAYAEILGPARHPGSLGQPGPEVWPQTWPDFEPRLQAVFEGVRDRFGERQPFSIEREDGAHPKFYTDAWTPVCDAAGRVVAAFGLIRETTDRVRAERAEAALRESEARFREMADGLPLIVWLHDANGDQEMVNETFCEFFGVTREHMKGGNWQILMHPDDADAYVSEFAACVRDRRRFHAEVRVRRADGTWRWLESWGRPRFTGAGEYKGFVGTSADVTSRKEAEAARRRVLREQTRQRQFLETLLASARVCVAVMEGTELRYVLVNPAYQALQPETPMLGRRYCDVFPEAARSGAEALVRRVLETGGSRVDHGYAMPIPGKPDAAWDHHVVRLPDDPDQLPSVLVMTWDVTEHQRAEAALREADRRKDEFLAMLGHELRTPLAAIRSTSDLLDSDGTTDEALMRARTVLRRQTQHMTHLVDGLLDVSRVARGKIRIDPEPVDARIEVGRVLDDMAHRVEASGLELRRRLPDEPLWIWADRVRFVQVASNLVGNAIKFTPPPGSVEVEVIRDGDEALLTVRDSGVGIRSEVLERLFEPFQQDEQGLERSAGGLGLGLSLVRGIVRRHGGQVAVSSGGVGAGTEVRVRWPLADGLPSDEATEPRPSVSSFRVLLVEDNDDLRELLAALLESSGHRVQTTETGVGALELMRSDGADVVICDLGLAGMSGYDVAREVREDPQLQHLPLVALTGYGQPEDRRRSAEAGFDEHLTKPVDIASLNATLARLCSDDTPAHLR